MQGERVDRLDATKRLPKLNRQGPDIFNFAEGRAAYLFDCNCRRPGHAYNFSGAEPSIVKNPDRPLTSIRYRTFAFIADKVSCAHCSLAVIKISTRVAGPDVSMKENSAKSTMRILHFIFVHRLSAACRRFGEVLMSSLPDSLITTSPSVFSTSICIGSFGRSKCVRLSESDTRRL